MSQCRSCKAEIIWAINPETGRRVPLDAKPLTMFELSEEDEEGQAPEAYPVPVYQSHFVTCPDRDAWRRR